MTKIARFRIENNQFLIRSFWMETTQNINILFWAKKIKLSSWLLVRGQIADSMRGAAGQRSLAEQLAGRGVLNFSSPFRI
jgi:hypothetical protein